MRRFNYSDNDAVSTGLIQTLHSSLVDVSQATADIKRSFCKLFFLAGVYMAALNFRDTVLCTATMGFRPLREFLTAAGEAGFTAVSLCGKRCTAPLGVEVMNAHLSTVPRL